jgi:hypothetical protein
MWTWKERSLFGVLLAVFILASPGFGPETREAPSGAWMAIMTLLFFLPPVVSFAASWKWPVLAGWFGLVSGIALVVFGALDVAGLIIGTPPAGMVVVDGLMIAVGVLIAWRMWVLLPPRGATTAG